MGVGRIGAVAASMLVALLLTGCGSSDADGPGGSRDAYDAIGTLGVDCSTAVIGDQSGLPYTSIGCVGLQIDWLDDEDDYEALVRADCDATPAPDRTGLEQTVLVVGPRWVLRGTDPTGHGSWPRQVSPQDAAQALGGTVTSAAAYCRQVGAWA